MNSDRDIVLISVFTFLTVSLWVFFEFVKTVKTTTVSSTVAQVITPFSPTIDADILTEIVKRKIY
ncbi:hypothetical protein A2875_03185 [Candidatus Gottesmanbacteria bacterium RIFCSPHIGHO2_01_FULL_46_14]|uniref:Uncharacterized protein n=2 Tax=Candidatus Gottesmaniibacteriota TaxID=1752720 RepID=A0A1F5ZR22_9BACT|nr:MAG: hypothetical protein A2875_03185 [Candidatus Gottesmanbacteria bacterium RIFCSPHIGHO2_01_FULL_46_14]OGG30364.1 MAG: hypothetical protein A2971_02085 [Candidatus Gottesmanbacteria bacterium RIFCSPLOWO2_01_FULL_46_21]